MAGRLEPEGRAEVAWGIGSGQVQGRRHSEEAPPPRDTPSSDPPQVSNVVPVQAPALPGARCAPRKTPPASTNPELFGT